MDLHPKAIAGREAWDDWCCKMIDLYWPEYNAAKGKLCISLPSNYDEMTNETRSAFAYTIEDYISRGIPTAKKKGKRK